MCCPVLSDTGSGAHVPSGNLANVRHAAKVFRTSSSTISTNFKINKLNLNNQNVHLNPLKWPYISHSVIHHLQFLS